MPKFAEPKTHQAYFNAKPKDKPYTISDGQGLSLLITPEGSKRWVFRYRFDDKEKKIALKGKFPALSVKDARSMVEKFHELLASRQDPGVVRKSERVEKQKKADEEKCLATQKATTFKVVAEDWIRVRLSKHAKSSRKLIVERLALHVFPTLGDRPISEISTTEFLELLRTIEDAGIKETAHRIRGYCDKIYLYALGNRLVDRNIPSELKGLLSPAESHHRSAVIDPIEFGQLLCDIDRYQGCVATQYYLKILPLVFTRPSELRLAEWEEVDLANGRLDIPASRMKMRRSHLVPLSSQVQDLLRELHKFTGNSPFLFSSTLTRRVQPISNVTALNALRFMGYSKEQHCPHGFRASARTLLDERKRIKPEYIEAQLAHKAAGPLGAAYNRTQFLEERAEMMQTWADYCDSLKSQAEKRNSHQQK